MWSENQGRRWVMTERTVVSLSAVERISARRGGGCMPSVDLRRRGARVWGRGFGWCRTCGACQRGNVTEVSTKSTSHQTLIAAKSSTHKKPPTSAIRRGKLHLLPSNLLQSLLVRHNQTSSTFWHKIINSQGNPTTTTIGVRHFFFLTRRLHLYSIIHFAVSVSPLSVVAERTSRRSAGST